MSKIHIEDLKLARETLCVAQTAINMVLAPERDRHISLIDDMIQKIDILRPLGSDGKHGDLHTMECRCDLEIFKTCKNCGNKVCISIGSDRVMIHLTTASTYCGRLVQGRIYSYNDDSVAEV